MEIKPVNCDNVIKITSIDDLRAYKDGVVVRLSDFAEGQPFVARIRRPSMIALVKTGQIPNELLDVATKMFDGRVSTNDESNTDLMSKVYDVCEAVCDAALVEPTLAEIKEAGMELTDQQYIEVFNYAQIGVNALRSFRSEREGVECDIDGANVQLQA